MIRSPEHTRKNTDKINFVTIEFMKTKPRINEYLGKCAHKATFCEPYEGANYRLMIRQNAIQKGDSAYLNFIQSAYFIPLNFAGEMLISQSNDDNISNASQGKEELMIMMP